MIPNDLKPAGIWLMGRRELMPQEPKSIVHAKRFFRGMSRESCELNASRIRDETKPRVNPCLSRKRLNFCTFTRTHAPG